MSHPRTLYDKLWDAHLVHQTPDGPGLIYIDRHLVHEVSSPQAFEGLRTSGRAVRAPQRTIATPDHNVPTDGARADVIANEMSRIQVDTLRRNAADFGVPIFDLDDERQGIVHVIGPEQGMTLPGMTIVCGDSHTSTHGAFGALAHGIGTSEVEHVLATQTLIQAKSKNMLVRLSGDVAQGVSAKDIALAVIGYIGTAGGTGHVIEYAGDAVTALTMEGRMTLCNMTVEAGARAGLIAPDQTTYDYIKGRPFAPAPAHWPAALQWWRTLRSDPGAVFDTVVDIDATAIAPMVTWGTSPEDVLPITGRVPDPATLDRVKRDGAARSLAYMGLKPGTLLQDIAVDTVFIGSCTNARIEDLRAVAQTVRGHVVRPGLRAMVVPGSGLVRAQAEREGIGDALRAAGFDLRFAGCSMCVGMNPDQLAPGERCAATSNRNFEGRQGPGGRTHLMSPAMAAAAAITGHLTDVRAFAKIGSSGRTNPTGS